jgi:GH24 family phage-related lysozyme (muramidase)
MGAGEALAGASGCLMVAGGRRRRRREGGDLVLPDTPAAAPDNAEPGLLDKIGAFFSHPDTTATERMSPEEGLTAPIRPEGLHGTAIASNNSPTLTEMPSAHSEPHMPAQDESGFNVAHLPQPQAQAPHVFEDPMPVDGHLPKPEPVGGIVPIGSEPNLQPKPVPVAPVVKTPPTPPPRPGSVDLPRTGAPVPTPRPPGLAPATDANGNPIDQFFGSIGKGLGQIGTDIGHGLDAFGNFITGIPQSISNGLAGAGDAARGAVTGVEHITGGLGDAAKGAVAGVGNTLRDTHEAITGAGQNIGNFLDRTAGAQKAGIPYFGNFSDSGPQGIVFHHTGGRGTPDGVINTLAGRGLASNYVMDRDGTVVQILPNGQRGAHIRSTDEFKDAAAQGLSNKNTLGIEMIAKDNNDLTDAQKASAVKFANAMRQQYNNPNMPVYGHGELNPGHKQSTEGMGAVDAVRAADNANPGPQGPSVPSPRGLAPTVQDTAPMSATGLAGGQQASDARTTFAMAQGRPWAEAYQHGIQGILGKEEAFRDKVYWDKSAGGGGHWAIGYGTHMIPGADGKMRDVVPGDTITPEASYATLRQRVMTEFVPRAKQAVGAQAWGALPPNAQDALAATVYNAGHMPSQLIGPIKSGNLQAIAAALRALPGDKLHKERRDREAQLVESGRVR